MGFNYWAWVATHWLLENSQVSKAASLGRQVLHVHDCDRNGKEIIQYGLSGFLSESSTINLPFADEAYFNHMNTIVDSIDYSDYEYADVLADLSIPFRDNDSLKSLEGCYDAVFDIGTSEHVGNCFASIENAMRLLREGGLYVYDLPYANWMNHGLIQFCPSYFSELARTNGYELLLQFMHPTCRQGELVFAKDNISYSPRVITSIYGCIRKTGASNREVSPPVQTFCNEEPPETLSELELQKNQNYPLFNLIHPDDFISYLDSEKSYPLHWSSWSGSRTLGDFKLFNPKQNINDSKITIF